jgi:hypothetical protein
MVDFEKLNYKERESYQKIIDAYKTKSLTVADFKLQITELLFAVMRELVDIDKTADERNTYLKARAKNYLLLMDILTAPEIAEKQMKEAEARIEKKVSK